MTFEQALQKLTAMCASAEHCEHEMMEKMRRWEVAEPDQQRVMAYLREKHFVDDERYARAFISDKVKYNKWGRRKVEQALWAKQIAEDIRQRALDDVENSTWHNMLRELLEAKRRQTKARDDYEMKMKLTRFAMSRGFDYDIIKDCTDDIIKGDAD